MAEKWASSEKYPLTDTTSLPRVMQYIATQSYGGDATSLKERFVVSELADADLPEFTDPFQIHSFLAKFDLPLYVTTNYDNFMYEALRYRAKRPKVDHSRWYEADVLGSEPTPFSDPEYDPTAAEPLVFHLHGHFRIPKSLVLTEDDYIDYLVRLAHETQERSAKPQFEILPNYVYSSLRNKPLLFIGYSLRDWTFLVLFRTLLRGIPENERRKHVSVQVDPGEGNQPRARAYLEKYFRAQSVQIFWESASDFAEKLQIRMEGYAG